ncbi:MAG: hypothetical protein WBV94_21150 [Blastocatellia bacterium]
MTSRKSIKSWSVVGLAILSMLLPPLSSLASARQSPFLFEYAVKFVCGPAPTTGVVAPGRYFTAINVHNPQNQTASFRKKVAVALPKQQPGPVTQFVPATLGPDQAFEIDCADVRDLLGPINTAFVKGFVVVQSPVELDIVAVYTASGSTGQVETIHTERVPPRRIAP